MLLVNLQSLADDLYLVITPLVNLATATITNILLPSRLRLNVINCSARLAHSPATESAHQTVVLYNQKYHSSDIHLEITQQHFRAEEQLMEEFHLDAEFANAHRKAHISLAEQVRIVASMLENTIAPSAPTLCKLLPFLQKWMIFHVIGTDMRMARMIQTLQRGGSPEDALREGMSQQTESLVMLLDSLNFSVYSPVDSSRLLT